MSTEKYLNNYAEPEARLDFSSIKTFEHCLVIPCRDESLQLIERLKTLLIHSPNALIILVINQPESQTDNTINQSLSIAAKEQLKDNVLVIDRYSPNKRINNKQGVGLARKIGCDIACALIQQKLIASQWINTSDGDVSWPQNYFQSLPCAKSYSAAVYPFTHIQANNKANTSITLYELSLHYYVAGLSYAGSPYAYHTIGSTLTINANNYAMVRGFPKRSAGEDFHLLNKLRKTGTILSLSEPTLLIDDRESSRTPFGTGPAVATLNAMNNPIDEYLYYHPQCFERLKQWLDTVPLLFELTNVENCIIYMEQQLPRILFKGLISAKIEALLAHCFAQSKTNKAFTKQLHDGFDALSTLRLIHFLRDNNYPSINIKQLQNLSSFITPLIKKIDSEYSQVINKQWLIAINHELENLQTQNSHSN